MRPFLTVVLLCLTHWLAAQPPPATLPTAPYSPAVEANGFVFISGQIGRSNGKLVTDSFEAEAHQVLKNVGQVLVDNKLSFGDVVNVTIYLKDMKRYDATNAVYRTYFTTARLPARVCVAVADLPAGASIEVSAVAVRKP